MHIEIEANMSTIQPLQTYGDKPISFQLEESGEYYYVGSEVSVKIWQSVDASFRFVKAKGHQIFSLFFICSQKMFQGKAFFLNLP